jgi:hypothetical protein
MMKAIGLTGRENENQAIVAAQLLDRLTQRGVNVSVCLGVTSVEHANVIHLGDGELWRIGPDVSHAHLDAQIDRVVDTSCEFYQLIERVDHALGLFLGKKAVG